MGNLGNSVPILSDPDINLCLPNWYQEVLKHHYWRVWSTYNVNMCRILKLARSPFERPFARPLA